MKISDTTEWTLILAGHTRAVVGGDIVELWGGNYVLIHPGVPNNLVDDVLADTVGITVKSPSDPAAKHEVTTPHQLEKPEAALGLPPV